VVGQIAIHPDFSQTCLLMPVSKRSFCTRKTYFAHRVRYSVPSESREIRSLPKYRSDLQDDHARDAKWIQHIVEILIQECIVAVAMSCIENGLHEATGSQLEMNWLSCTAYTHSAL
jgi:hypothetical protein